MKLPLFKIYWNKDDVQAVLNVIKSGSFWCSGKEIEEFEKKIAEYVGSKYCVVFNSGGSALHALMEAYGFGPGDEIIVPSFTFIATAMAPLYVRAKPVFADIEKQTFGLDPEDVISKITPKTKAIIPIHYGGIPCKIEELKKIANENNLILIEDAAESFGAKIGEKFVGTFGDSAIFSFCQNKIFTTSEGGAVVTNNKDLYNKLKLLVSYGRVSSGNYFRGVSKTDYILKGYNWRMSSILAALGVSQIEKVDFLINKRRQNARYLNEKLKEIEDIELLQPPENYFSVYQMYPILLENNEIRDKLISYLLKRGIHSKVYFSPVHEFSLFKDKNKNLNLPNTKNLSSRILSLPFYPDMSKEEMNFLINTLKEFFGDKNG